MKAGLSGGTSFAIGAGYAGMVSLPTTIPSRMRLGELRAHAGELGDGRGGVVDRDGVLRVAGDIGERRHRAGGVEQRLDAVRERPLHRLGGADEMVVGETEHLHPDGVEVPRQPGPRRQIAGRRRQRSAVGRAHQTAAGRELPVVDQEGVERRRLPVHRFLRGDLEHLGALLGPVQRRVGLVPHVVHADDRPVVRERVPRLPGEERALRHARGRADDQPGEDDGDAQAHHLGVAGQRPPAALGRRDQREQREHQEDAGAERVRVEREHRAREGEQAERDADRRQGGAAAHDQPHDRAGGGEEGQAQVVVRAGEAARVDGRVRLEPVAQAVHHELGDADGVDPVPRLPRPRVRDLADRGHRSDDQREQRRAAAPAEHGGDRGQRGEQDEHGEAAEAHVRLLEPGPVPAAEEEQRAGEDGGRDPRARHPIHARPPAAGPEPRGPGRHGRRPGSGRRRRPSG